MSMVVLLIAPPAVRISTPPASTVPPLTMPAASTTSTPPLWMMAPWSAPAVSTNPLLATTVPVATPPM